MTGPTVAKIATGVYVATAETYTTTTTIVAGDDGGCLLVDPAVTVADLAALAGWLAARGLHPVAGWSTHPHWDHLLWSRALGGAPRYATPRAAAVACGQADLIRDVQEGAPGHDLTLFARVPPHPGRQFDWPGPRVLVYAHDAHAPGHGALFLPDVGVLVAGDMCSDVEIPLLDLDSADPFLAYREGLGLLAGVAGVRLVVPGHGHVGDGAEFRRRIARRLEDEDRDRPVGPCLVLRVGRIGGDRAPTRRPALRRSPRGRSSPTSGSRPGAPPAGSPAGCRPRPGAVNGHARIQHHGTRIQ